MTFLWCTVHSSQVIRDPETDPDTYWLCESSNLTGDKQDCEVVEAEITWPSQ